MKMLIEENFPYTWTSSFMDTSIGAARVHMAKCSFLLAAEGAENVNGPFLQKCFAEISEKLEREGFTMGR